MSGIEDVRRQVMVSHDQEAPAAADLLRALEAAPGPPGRRGKAQCHGGRRRAAWAVPIAAAAAMVVVIGLAVSVSNGLFGTLRPAWPAHVSVGAVASGAMSAVRAAGLIWVDRWRGSDRDVSCERDR